MRSSRALPVLFTLVLLTVAAIAIPPARYSVSPQSKIFVDGTSTLHAFTCEASKFTGTFDGEAGAKSLSRVEIKVPVKSLGCGNGQMDKKMYDAFDSDKNTEIKFVTTNITAKELGGGKYTLTAQGKLAMAGQEKPVSLTVSAVEQSNGQIRFTGSAPIVMSQWGMKRPSAAMGTIKTGDKVTVRFDVVAKAQ